MPLSSTPTGKYGWSDLAKTLATAVATSGAVTIFLGLLADHAQGIQDAKLAGVVTFLVNSATAAWALYKSGHPEVK